VEVLVAATDPVGRIAVASRCPLLPFRKHQHQRPVGKETACRELVKITHPFDPQAAGAALIRKGRIDKAVAYHPIAAIESRPNRPLDVIRASGREQQSFGFDRPVPLLQQQAPN
jgi:hypothetical protein